MSIYAHDAPFFSRGKMLDVKERPDTERALLAHVQPGFGIS
jgi:hypothetical protein